MIGNEEQRIRRLTQESMKELSVRRQTRKQVFSFRGPGLLQGTETGVWLFRLWYLEEMPVTVSIAVPEQSTDDSLKQALVTALESEAKKLEL